jgi:hypothetical protein
MIEKQTVVDFISIETGITVRLKKQIVEDGEVLSFGYHRFGINQDSNIDAVIDAVNADLGNMGYPPVAVDDIDRIKAHAAVAWAE